jgi:Cd2+/Zn2+-exporting ATPase
MLTVDSQKMRLQLGVFLFGGLLLGISWVATFLFERQEIAVLVALLAAVLLGAPLVYNAIKDLWQGRLEMNELAALSFMASLGTAQYQVAAVIALFLVGAELIEFRSQLGARKNLQALLRLAPSKARIQREDGFERIDAALLAPDDTVQVLPGERIPGDGTVLDGVSAVDQSAVTGESIPVEIQPGAEVFGGTINQTGVLLVRITSPAKDSTLAKIQDLIARAEGNQTPVIRLVNRYVSWYTPIILMCAAIVLFFTRDIDRAIAMLIVACPCTIILSTPTAFVAALSAAARVGVIIKDLKSLEVAKRVDMLMFD